MQPQVRFQNYTKYRTKVSRGEDPYLNAIFHFSGFVKQLSIPQVMEALRIIISRTNPALSNDEVGNLLPNSYNILMEQMANNNFQVSYSWRLNATIV